jgi:hypothetical protein
MHFARNSFFFAGLIGCKIVLKWLMSSSPVFIVVRVARALVFCVVFCRSLSVLVLFRLENTYTTMITIDHILVSNFRFYILDICEVCQPHCHLATEKLPLECCIHAHVVDNTRMITIWYSPIITCRSIARSQRFLSSYQCILQGTLFFLLVWLVVKLF